MAADLSLPEIMCEGLAEPTDPDRVPSPFPRYTPEDAVRNRNPDLPRQITFDEEAWRPDGKYWDDWIKDFREPEEMTPGKFVWWDTWTEHVKNQHPYTAQRKQEGSVSKELGVKEKEMEIDGVKINYVKHGKGKYNILCFPGMMGFWQRDYGLHIEKFKKQFTVVAFDPPGYGKSRPPERVFDMETTKRDADVGFKLMEKLNLLPFSPIGWSEGGRSALQCAYEHPEEVSKVVVWGTTANVSEKLFKYFINTPDWRDFHHTSLEQLQGAYDDSEISEMWLSMRDFYLDTYHKREDFLPENYLGKIKQPVLILHGKKDEVLEQDREANHLRDNLAKPELRIKEEGYHDLHNKFPYWFRLSVEKFILKQEGEKIEEDFEGSD